jgi:RNA:NAD 2'-phosphotransferase (TPT1/KptA family)
MGIKRSSSLFPNFYEFKRVLELCVKVLQMEDIKKDEEGFYDLNYLCEKLKKEDKNLTYLTTSHIIELFIRDPKKRILITNDNKIKYKNIKYVQPPEILYFGTTNTLLEKMKKNGIKSVTKGYIKLFLDPKEALEFAKKFVKEQEQVTYLSIKAKEAFENGIRFSSFKDGIYIVTKIDKNYIL